MIVVETKVPSRWGQDQSVNGLRSVREILGTRSRVIEFIGMNHIVIKSGRCWAQCRSQGLEIASIVRSLKVKFT